MAGVAPAHAEEAALSTAHSERGPRWTPGQASSSAAWNACAGGTAPPAGGRRCGTSWPSQLADKASPHRREVLERALTCDQCRARNDLGWNAVTTEGASTPVRNPTTTNLDVIVPWHTWPETGGFGTVAPRRALAYTSVG